MRGVARPLPRPVGDLRLQTADGPEVPDPIGKRSRARTLDPLIKSCPEPRTQGIQADLSPSDQSDPDKLRRGQILNARLLHEEVSRVWHVPIVHRGDERFFSANAAGCALILDPQAHPEPANSCGGPAASASAASSNTTRSSGMNYTATMSSRRDGQPRFREVGKLRGVGGPVSSGPRGMWLAAP